MKIIDAHAHIIEYLSGFGSRGELRALGKGKGRWATGEETQFFPSKYGDKEFTYQTLIKLMENNNIEKAIILQGHLYGFQNDYISEAVKKYPDHLVGAGIVDPYCLDAPKIIERLVNDLKFQILKFEISTEYGLSGYHEDYRIDGIKMKLVWDNAFHNDMTVVLDIGTCAMKSFQPDAIINILEKYKGLRVVIAHLLSPFPECEDVFFSKLKTLRNENLWFDIASLPVFGSDEPYPFPTSLKYLSYAKKVLGPDRLVWGSDIPMMLNKGDYGDLFNYIYDSNIFCKKELEDVMYNKAREAFKI